MTVSTRGRYALRVMLDLAEKREEGYVPLKDIAKRQDISHNYIARILPLLSKAELIVALHGKGGGYKLNRTPEKCTVGEILRITEESLAPVACLECSAEPCKRAHTCKTLPMWKKAEKMMAEYFDSITLKDILDGKV